MKKIDIERYNEWWFTEKIRRELTPDFKRVGLKRVLDSLRERQILMITGLRRVGKTTLFYQTIEKLIEKIEPKRILYFSFDEYNADPKKVLETYEKKILSKSFEDSGKIFIFFDEIQYAKGWASVIKQYYDLYPNIKFFLSGSSSLLLSREALNKLAGRFFFFELKPLSFIEFLNMKGFKLNGQDIFSRRIEIFFFDYLKRAGFPEIVNLDERRIGEYIKYSIIDRIVFRDVPTLLKTREMRLMENLVRFICANPGAIINLNSLASDFNTTRITISNYLKLLEISLLLRKLKNFRYSYLSFSRKLSKYYPVTTSLIYSVFREKFERESGLIIETYAVNALDAEFYYRKNNQEIDVILQRDRNIIPVEIKENFSESDIKKFLNITQKFNPKKKILVTLSEKSIKKEGIIICPVYHIEDLVQNLSA